MPVMARARPRAPDRPTRIRASGPRTSVTGMAGTIPETRAATATPSVGRRDAGCCYRVVGGCCLVGVLPGWGPGLRGPAAHRRCAGRGSPGSGEPGPCASTVGGPPPSSADESISALPGESLVPAAKQAGRAESDAPRNYGHSVMPLRGTRGDPSPAELSAFLIVCYKPESRMWAGWGSGRRVGVTARAPVPSPPGRTAWPRGPAVLGDSHQGRAVRLSEFWTRMRAQFGDAYATSVAKDHVLAGLGSGPSIRPWPTV